MKKLLPILCIIAVICLSCKQIMLKQYGVAQPKIENYASLNRYLLSNGIEGIKIYAMKDTASLMAQYAQKISMPEAYFYNKDGYFVPYKETEKACNAGVSPFLDSVGSFNKLPFEATKNISDLLPDIAELNPDNTVSAVKALPKSDVYVVMNWAKYLGKVNKDKTWDWIDHIKRNGAKSPQKITIVLLSFDYQETWGITKKDIPKFSF